jgi:peptidoglycan/LPS O-acetylase OafA/YrhL
MLDAFYGAFSTACFALLGLWLVIVQMRISEWEKDPVRRRRSYGVALHFALPGIMSVFALIDSQTAAYWRVSFAVVAFGGAVVMAAVRGFPARDGSGRGLPVSDQLGVAAYAMAIILYVLIGVLALVPGHDALRTEAVLLTVLVFLGFNVAWLLMFADSPSAGARPVGG